MVATCYWMTFTTGGIFLSSRIPYVTDRVMGSDGAWDWREPGGSTEGTSSDDFVPCLSVHSTCITS